jgi:hypothetical protein
MTKIFDNKTPKVGELSQPKSFNLQLKPYGIALAIIVTIGGLVVATIGLIGYHNLGALKNLSQTSAISMMAVGTGGGTIAGVVAFDLLPDPDCAWQEDYNKERSHSSLGDKIPEEFALEQANLKIGKKNRRKTFRGADSAKE